MEAGYMNFHDGEHFASISSPLYDQDILDDSESSLLDIMRDDFSYEASQFDQVLWEHEQELNDNLAVLPLSVPLDGPLPKLESHSKEDFQKMLSDWQDHLGSMQASDSEDMDVKDIVGLDIVMPKHNTDELPDDIFDSCDLKSTVHLVDKFVSCTKQDLDLNHQVTLSLSLKEEDFSSFSLENFLEGGDDEEDDDDKFGLTVAEDDSADLVNEKKTEINDDPLVSELECLDDVKAETDEGCIDIDNIKIEIEEDCIDVETISEQIPVLEAGDLKSLLEQFEASEAFNSTSTATPSKPSILDTHLYAMATQQLETPNNTKQSNVGTPMLSHQNIRDSLPKEVIERIKASGRKKVIPLIPAMPSKRPGRSGTRMQDAAATLSRNKLLKLVSGNGSGESIQLDHDYCTFNSTATVDIPAPPKSFYHSDASDYSAEKLQSCQQSVENVEENGAKCYTSQDKIYSRLPDYYVVLAPQKSPEKSNRWGARKDDNWDKNSKKDSGLESGDVSDASEETIVSAMGSGICDDVLSSTASANRNEFNEIPSDSTAKSVLGSLTESYSVRDCSNIAVNVKNIKVDVTSKGSGASTLCVNKSAVDSAGAQNQTCVKAKEMTMVSVLKKCQANVNTSGQPYPVCSVSVNNDSLNQKKETQERPQGTTKRKINLAEYRNRVKDRFQNKGSSCVNSSISSSADQPSEVKSENKEEEVANKSNAGIPPVYSESNPAVPRESVTTEANMGSDLVKKDRPIMHSVEVQTQPLSLDYREDGKERRIGHLRDHRHRHYRSRRASSSSSSGSSSSSHSRFSHKHKMSSEYSQRHKTSQRHSSSGHSISSSGSRSRSVWSRSRSNSPRSSSSSSRSSTNSCSQSRSRSSKIRRSPDRWHSHSIRHSQQAQDYRRKPSTHSGYRGWRRSRSPVRRSRSPLQRSRSPVRGSRSPVRGSQKNVSNEWQLTEREKQLQVEERRVIYVGRIDEGTSKATLRRRFELFGPIVDISIHFREHGDNYGFVTFAYKVDAYEAVEHGNDDPNLPHYDLCFGGRRAFCKTQYADLDGMATINDTLSGSNGYSRGAFGRNRSRAEDSFDLLLREAQAKLRKRKV